LKLKEKSITGRRKKKKVSKGILLLVFFVGLIAVPTDNDEVLCCDKLNAIPIEKIWAEKASIENEEVVILGEYRGWQDDIPNPHITRSDWIVRNHTGAIYITGKSPGTLYPLRDTGTKIIVKGVVKISKNGVPYIDAKEVKIQK
jgi:hypothetical protein